MTKWEHKEVTFTTGNLANTLSNWGRQGWELVSVVRSTTADPNNRAYLKRPVQETDETNS